MITTTDIQQGHHQTFYHTGDESSKEVVLIIGSCRATFYVNYLDIWNRENGNQFSIYCIDPHNYHWDKTLTIRNLQTGLLEADSSERFKDIVSRTTIYIHEYYKNYGVFNTDRSLPKNIYDFGMKAGIDIRIPNWHHRMVWFDDIERSWPGKYSPFEKIAMGHKTINSFVAATRKSSVPAFADYFYTHWRKEKLFSDLSHVCSGFALTIFNMICRDHLKIGISADCMEEFKKIKMFDNSSTKISQLEIDGYGLEFDGDQQADIAEL